MKKRFLTLLLLALVAAAAYYFYSRPPSAQVLSGIVNTDWAAQHLNDPNVRIIEVDPDTTAYSQAHIYLDESLQLARAAGDNLRTAIREELDQVLGVIRS